MIRNNNCSYIILDQLTWTESEQFEDVVFLLKMYENIGNGNFPASHVG